MDASKITTGARLHGAVMHVITKGMHNDVTACGRVVIPGKGEGARLCRTCVRVSPDARRMSDRTRKAERDARMHESVVNSTDEMGEEFISWEFSLNEYELAMTREKIEKINARCEKRGIPGGLNVEWREVTEKETNAFGIEIEYVVFMTKITGIAPKLPNWEFVATLDYDIHAGLIVRTYPGVKSIDRSLLRNGWCDHCQTDRYRKSTYVMRNTETGEYVQVGSSCIKDFTGWTALPYSPDKMKSDVEEFTGEFGGRERDVTTLTALAIAWAVVTEYGFVRTNEPGATKGIVLDVINPPKRDKWNAEYLEDLKRLSKHSADMYGRAEELRAWIGSDEFSGSSEYVLNLKSIARAEKVSFRNMGILASAPQAWARFLERTLIRKVEKGTSVHVGEIGERWSLALTVETERNVETQYGSSTLYKLSDASGNVFSWFASSPALDGMVGERVSLTAGIKAHKDWKGNAETAITRCKVIDGEVENLKIKDAPVKAKDEMLVGNVTVDMNGVYFFNNTYYKIRTVKGIAYAVKFTDNGWEYSPKSIHVIKATDAISAEDAARFGHTHKRCVFCAKGLTDERSVTVGYGPDCAERVGLPWGE